MKIRVKRFVSMEARDTTAMDRAAAKFATADVDYIYEQPPAELFRSLLPRYIAVQMYRAVLESVAAEHAARMTAMDSATNNATDMIGSLTLTMNRRQHEAWERAALHELRVGDPATALRAYQAHGRVTIHAEHADTRAQLAQHTPGTLPSPADQPV